MAPKKDPAAFMFRGRAKQLLIKLPGDLQGSGFCLRDLEGCEVYLLDHSAQVMVDDCVDCRIFIGPCAGSVFLRDCKRCTVCVASRQFRLRDCQDLDIAIYCCTQPSIETSSGVTFGAWRGAFPQAAELFAAAKLDPANNTWSKIFDFNAGEEVHGQLEHWRVSHAPRPLWVPPAAALTAGEPVNPVPGFETINQREEVGLVPLPPPPAAPSDAPPPLQPHPPSSTAAKAAPRAVATAPKEPTPAPKLLATPGTPPARSPKQLSPPAPPPRATTAAAAVQWDLELELDDDEEAEEVGEAQQQQCGAPGGGPSPGNGAAGPLERETDLRVSSPEVRRRSLPLPPDARDAPPRPPEDGERARAAGAAEAEAKQRQRAEAARLLQAMQQERARRIAAKHAAAATAASPPAPQPPRAGSGVAQPAAWRNVAELVKDLPASPPASATPQHHHHLVALAPGAQVVPVLVAPGVVGYAVPVNALVAPPGPGALVGPAGGPHAGADAGGGADPGGGAAAVTGPLKSRERMRQVLLDLAVSTATPSS